MSTSAAARIRTVGIAAGAFALAWTVTVVATTYWYGHDNLRAYHDAIQGWLDGQPLYSGLDAGAPFDLAPLAAVFFIPVTAWSVPVAVVLTTGISLLAVLLCARLCFAEVTARLNVNSRWGWTAAIALTLLLEPTRNVLGLGQISLVLLAVILVDLVFVARGRWWGGIGIGLAVAAQPAFGVLILFLLLTRRLRAAFAAAATVIVATVFGLLFLPEATGTYLTEILFTPENTGPLSAPDNQALSGVLARLYEVGTDPAVTWLGFALFTVVWGLTRAREAHLRGNRLTAVAIAGLTGCLVSPVGPSYLFVWFIPALAVLLGWAMTKPPALHRPGLMDRTWGRWAITVGFLLCFTVTPIHWNPGGFIGLLTDNTFMIAAIALIAVLPKAAHRSPEDRFAVESVAGMNRLASSLCATTQ